MRILSLILFSLTMGHLSIASTNSDECIRVLGGNASPPAFKISGLEQEVSSALSHFFVLYPKAQSLFRTAFYGASRNSINTILEIALNTIPPPNRAEVTKAALIKAMVSGSAAHRKFIEQIIEASLTEHQGSELFEVPRYFYFDLLTILKATQLRGDQVLTFRNGRGDFAVRDISESCG